MRYFVPSLRLGVLMPRQTPLEEKRGGVSAEDFPCFFDDAELARLPAELVEQVPLQTKLGGAPAWIQSAGASWMASTYARSPP